MDTKKLRQKILDLAIRGKLVPQDPNDEPASVLLERIRAEKEQLIKEGKIKRSKKSAATDKSHYENVPFEIPENWCWTTINDIAFVTKLAGFEYTKYIADNISKNDGIPLFKGKNVLNGEVVYEFESYIPRHISDELFRSQISKKCLLTPYVGTIGNIGIHNKEGIYHLGSNVGKIELFNGLCVNVYEEYVKFYLLSSYGYKELTKQKKATAQESISIEAIREVLIPLPPVAEQLRIVNEIDNKLSYIKEISKDCGKISELIGVAKSKILELAISGKLAPQDIDDEPAIELLKRINPDFKPCDNSHYENLPFEIPSTWVWVSHNDMLEISGGAQPPKSEFSEVMKPGYIRLYQIRDYGEKPIPIYIPLSTASKTTVKGDILLARYGGSLGKVFIAEDGAYNVAMAKVILCYPEVLNQKFVYYYYLSSIYQNKLRSISRTAQAGFNSGDFEDMYFPLPPLEEQGRIVDAISSIWEMIDMITAEL